ncbi:MAG TPA: hypothetical protein VFQ75_00820 [Candidatus Limnocylindrales bacterium]|jgi:hypothetical protein|nr:hypothetical protein [Candidatus Limnocylindrales bacterium]
MSAGSRKKRQSVGQTVGGMMFGFEQQVLRTAPPPEELVHHARPDAPIPGADGELLTLELPEGLEVDDPWAGIEDELSDDDDPWADYAAEAQGEAP